MSPVTTVAATISLIRETLALLHEPTAVVELCVFPKSGALCGGYFDDHARLAEFAANANGAGLVFVTLNPVDRRLLKRARNAVRPIRRRTTSGDIIRLVWLFVDFDPLRPARTSSTETEHLLALERANNARAWLVTCGVPANAIVIADSGNGAHLLLHVDLSNEERNVQLLNRCRQALAARFDDVAVKVDHHTSDAGRLIKLYGTLATKSSVPQIQ